MRAQIKHEIQVWVAKIGVQAAYRVKVQHIKYEVHEVMNWVGPEII